MKLTTKIFFILLGFALLPMIAFHLYPYRIAEKAQYTREIDFMRTVHEILLTSYQEKIRDRVAIFSTLQRNPEIRNELRKMGAREPFDSEMIAHSLQGVLSVNESILAVSLFNEQGDKQISFGWDAEIPVPLLSLLGEMAGAETYRERYVLTRTATHVVFAVPVDIDDKRVGTVVALAGGELSQYLPVAPHGALSTGTVEYVITGGNGIRIKSEGEDFLFAGEELLASDYHQLLNSLDSGTPMEMIGKSGEVVVVLAGMPLNSNIIVLIQRNKQDVLSWSLGQQQFFMMITFFGLIGAVVAAYVFARVFASPAEHLLRSAENIAAGNYRLKTGFFPTDEVGRVAFCVDTLAEKVLTAQAERDTAERQLKNYRRDAREITTVYNALMNHFHEAVFLVSFNRKDMVVVIDDMNESAAQFVGLRSKEDLLGKNFSEMVKASGVREVQKQFYQVLVEGEKIFPAEMKCSGNRIVPVEISARIFTFEGVPKAFAVVRESQASVDEPRLLMTAAAILNASDDSITAINPAGQIVSWNKGAERLFGYTAEEMLGKHISLLVPPDKKDEYVDVIEQVKRGESVRNLDTVRVNKAGQRLHLQVNLSPMMNEKGELAGISAVGRDVTERIRAERAARHQQRLLENIVSTAEAIVVILDLNGIILLFNRFAENLTGYRASEVLGKSWVQYFIVAENKAEIQAVLEATFHGGNIIREHVNPILLRDGTTRVIEWRNAYLHDESGLNTAVVAVGVDITERKQIEQELVKKTDDLQKLNEELEDRIHVEIDKRRVQEHLLMQQSKLAALGDMIGAIAHQWRQPLNALGLMIQDIQDAFHAGEMDITYLDEAVQKSMQQIYYMSHTIDDFRNFYQPAKAKQMFDVFAVMQETLSILSAQLQNNEIVVALENPENKSFAYVGYPNEFKQVVLSIVTNAKDAIIARKATLPELEGKIAISLTRSSDRITISIADNGGGIPPEILDRIFEPYFTTKEEGKGTGVGLYMSKMIIDKSMHGQLQAMNRGDGAVFVIDLLTKEGR